MRTLTVKITLRIDDSDANCYHAERMQLAVRDEVVRQWVREEASVRTPLEGMSRVVGESYRFDGTSHQSPT